MQPDGAVCGVFTSLNGSMLIETIQDDNLWAKINNAMDLDTLTVKPFWHRYPTTNPFDRTAIFRFKLARLMEYTIN